MSSNKESWGSRVGLILAMAGNAVGLGNFLRFPVQAVNNGGGAFIIPYLVCFLVMGIPLLWIEWSMGRFGGRFGNHSTPFILDNMTKKNFWKYFGVFGIFTNIAVASYYCYIESWTLSYAYHSLAQTFNGLDQQQVANFFDAYVKIGHSTTGIPYEPIVFYLICLILNTYILSRGLSNGIEKVAKVGVPMLLIFGGYLAYKGITLGSSGAPEGCDDCDAFLGLNFLWEPNFDSLTNPNVWLAAAGQIFFTLSVGMGTIHCYASYVRPKDDIALNAMSAGWMNGFVEIVLGASIVIPIAVGYLGLDWVRENAGFSMAFQTMPFLFGQWGSFLGTLSSFFWFGLLFFAGITSSLAMGTPWMGFMQDEFGWKRQKAAWSFGGIVLMIGLPAVLLYQSGVFWDYDYWAGTISLVVFALAESIIFAWIFGIDNAWDELNQGSDIFIPSIFKYILKFVTPTILLVVFLSSLIQPLNNDWNRAFSGEWILDPNSIIGKIQNREIETNRSYFSDHYESEISGTVGNVDRSKEEVRIDIFQNQSFYINQKGKKTPLPDDKEFKEHPSFIDSMVHIKSYQFKEGTRITVAPGDNIDKGDVIAKGAFVNDIFYIDMSRLFLSILFVFICILVYRASVNRQNNI